MQKNDIVELTITDLTMDGNGIGRYNDIVIFVPGTTSGDKLLVKIIKVCKNYSIGKIERMILSSPDRIDIDCEYYPKCGGCVFRHISYKSELKIKQKYTEDCISRIGEIGDIKINNIIGAMAQDRYRNKMQIPVRCSDNGEIISGFYRAHSHIIVECKDCKLNSYIFMKIINTIKIWMKNYKIKPYNEKLGTGVVRHIYLREAKATGQIMVCLVVNEIEIKFKEELINSLINEYKSIKSIVINFNSKMDNVILGKNSKIIWGDECITDEICKIKLNIFPNSFYQINHDQTEILYKTAAEMLDLNGIETVVDLYCGIGSIGLSVANYVFKLIGIEIVEEAVKAAKRNALMNNIKNARFICSDSVNAFNNSIKEFDFDPNIIILDPPRKGCEKKVIEYVSRTKVEKIIYISCNPSTLARDLKEFKRNNFIAEVITPVDLFPRTGHVECVVKLCRLALK